MKRRFLMMALVAMLVMALSTVVYGTQTDPQPMRAADECGAGLKWSLEGETLIITGSGAMDDFSDDTPWHDSTFRSLELRGGVTYIGANAFRDCDALETVDFGDALYEIGAEAFAFCDGLTSITLPASFKIFGEGAFQNCSNLTQIHCNGRFPSFRQNCLWGTYADIYYPVERPWGVEYIIQLEEAFGGRIHFYASDGTDPVPDETEDPTQPTQQPTHSPTQMPETEPVPESMPEPMVTVVPTEVVTEPDQTATPQTQPQTQAPPQSSSNGMYILAAILVLSLAGVALSVAALRKPKGKYSKKRRR